MRIDFCRLKNDSKAFLNFFLNYAAWLRKKAPLDHIFIVQSKKKERKLLKEKKYAMS